MAFFRIRAAESVIALWLCLIPGSGAQDAVPIEILQRTFLVKVGNTTGTAFTMDYEGAIYLVTARHVAASLPESKPVFQMWRNNKWEDVHAARRILPASADVDIALRQASQVVTSEMPKLPPMKREMVIRVEAPLVWVDDKPS